MRACAVAVVRYDVTCVSRRRAAVRKALSNRYIGVAKLHVYRLASSLVALIAFQSGCDRPEFGTTRGPRVLFLRACSPSRPLVVFLAERGQFA